ncbi:MAG: ferredoxin [Xenococcus sp. (in: cyanobacteria)]
MTKKSNSDSRNVLVCQGNTCSLSDSAQVLVAFQVNSPLDIKVIGCGCLGQCGNGPMVLILPEKIWYSEVSYDVVAVIIEQHLRCGKPVVNLLYQKFHPLPSYQTKSATNHFYSWLIALSTILALALVTVWVLSSRYY